MKSPSNFERLVLGCIDSYDSDQRLILLDFLSFFEILDYKICIPLHRSDLKISAKNRPNFCRNENEISFFIRVFQMKSILRFFGEILMKIFRCAEKKKIPEFRRNCQEMTKCLEILRKSVRKIWKMLEISEFVRNFHFSFHFFIRLPDVAQRPPAV